MLAAESDDHEAPPAETALGAPQLPASLRQRNRMLALTLVGFVGAMVVTFFALVVLYHYAAAHHMVTQF